MSTVSWPMSTILFDSTYTFCVVLLVCACLFKLCSKGEGERTSKRDKERGRGIEKEERGVEIEGRESERERKHISFVILTFCTSFEICSK